jgi:Tat protein secretion system quality control protein TatD with DNase activity
VAVGECGLDYAFKTYQPYSDKVTQKIVFLKHFDLAAKHGLPMHFFQRDASDDFMQILK